MRKLPRFLKNYVSNMQLQKCPECGQLTLRVFDRGDDCSNCGYNVYYP